MQQPTVLIIGGGAAGLCAAIAAAREGAAVTVVEASPRVGRKVLVSGNGRCNLSNIHAAPGAFNRPEFVQPVLDEYPCERIRSFFGGLGLLTFADDEGRVYPVTNAAASVLDVLRLECAHLGVDVRCTVEVLAVSPAAGAAGPQVATREGETFSADALIVTTGGGSDLLASTGHGSVERRPVLGPLRTATDPIRGLSGVRVRCAASLLAAGDGAGSPAVLATERGELLFRDYGVSGIMVFDLSRVLEPNCVISIDLFPDTELADLRELLVRRCQDLSWRSAETFFTGMLHERLARAVLRAAGVGPHTPPDRLPLERLAALLKDFRLDVLGMGHVAQAQVTRGGAAVDDFDATTMESRRVPGIFAAGEVLDVDGRSGGFNLHWAWASGIVAGESAARAAVERRSGEGGPGRGSA